MAITTIVGDPTQIKSIEEIDYFLSRVIDYERKKRCKAGVLTTQRLQFGGLYEIISENKAIREISLRRLENVVEFGIKFYKRSYFEVLKECLRYGRQPDYEELDREHTTSRYHTR